MIINKRSPVALPLVVGTPRKCIAYKDKLILIILFIYLFIYLLKNFYIFINTGISNSCIY